MIESDVVILKALLDSKGQFVSGNLIAKTLGISRVGVWARMEKLRDAGFLFEAVRHRGYRLLKEPSSLSAPLILAHLERMGRSLPVLFFENIDSTNIEAERQLAEGRVTPFVILAAQQVKGKGRLGRKWHSPSGGNAYMSFVFRPELPPSCMQSFTIWMGLSFCAFLNDSGNLPVGLKWPNDLVFKNRKVGGILTEARVDVDHTSELVLGLGININTDCDSWDPDLAPVAASLRSITGTPLLINEITAGLIHAGMTAYEKYIHSDHEKELEPLWNRFDVLGGMTITAQPGKIKLTGTVIGIDNGGLLKIKLKNGEVTTINSGEVTLGSAMVLAGTD